MKKLLPISCVSLLALLTSGCGCSLNQSKINSRSEALSKTDLIKDSDGNNKAFKIEYSFKSEVDDVPNATYTISYDTSSKAYIITDGSEVTKVYKENNKTVVEDSEKVKTTTTYGDPYYYIKESKYFTAIQLYDIYKNAPLYACHSYDNEDTKFSMRANTPDHKSSDYTISDSYVYSVKCKAEKPVFGKSATYAIEYRSGLDRLRDLEIKVDSSDRITELNITDQIANGANDENQGRIAAETYKVKFTY